MARSDSGFACHQHDDLVSYEVHHIQPRKYHGGDEPTNLVKVCPNAHSDIHHLLERLLRGKPIDLRDYGAGIRRIALQGYLAVMAYGEALSGPVTALEQSPRIGVPQTPARLTEAHSVTKEQE